MIHARTTLDDAPLSYRAWYALGSVYLESGRLEEGRMMLRKAIEFSPRSTSLYFALAESYRASGECDMAIPAYVNGLAIMDYAEPRAGLVACRMWVGQYQQARADAELGLSGNLNRVFSTWVRLADSAMRIKAAPQTMTFPKDSLPPDTVRP
jgi:tetratricopeptide (TPR) repeat protein